MPPARPCGRPVSGRHSQTHRLCVLPVQADTGVYLPAGSRPGTLADGVVLAPAMRSRLGSSATVPAVVVAVALVPAVRLQLGRVRGRVQPRLLRAREGAGRPRLGARGPRPAPARCSWSTRSPRSCSAWCSRSGLLVDVVPGRTAGRGRDICLVSGGCSFLHPPLTSVFTRRWCSASGSSSATVPAVVWPTTAWYSRTAAGTSARGMAGQPRFAWSDPGAISRSVRWGGDVTFRWSERYGRVSSAGPHTGRPWPATGWCPRSGAAGRRRSGAGCWEGT